MLAPYKSIQTSDISCPRRLLTWNSLESCKESRRDLALGRAPREPALSEVEGSKPSKARQLSATIHCHEETNSVEHNV